jgi:hypothetical protein
MERLLATHCPEDRDHSLGEVTGNSRARSYILVNA